MTVDLQSTGSISICQGEKGKKRNSPGMSPASAVKFKIPDSQTDSWPFHKTPCQGGHTRSSVDLSLLTGKQRAAKLPTCMPLVYCHILSLLPFRRSRQQLGMCLGSPLIPVVAHTYWFYITEVDLLLSEKGRCLFFLFSKTRLTLQSSSIRLKKNKNLQLPGESVS